VWRVEPREGAAYAAAAASYLAAVVAFLLLQEVGLRLRRAEARQWWAGAGRDLLNAAGLCAISGALRLLGLPWPAALVVGGTLTLVLFGASVFVATQTRTAHPRAWALAAGLAVAVAVLLWDDAVVRGFAAAARLLFGPGGGPQ
jgi:hypothetical protein